MKRVNIDWKKRESLTKASVVHDLNAYFSVLDELSEKIDEYQSWTKMPFCESEYWR